MNKLENHLADVMRKAVRQVLQQVAQNGLPGDYHLYITFATQFPGVRVSPPVAAQYPEEMTIVLQHMFWGLEVDAEAFEVTVSFSGARERLRVPFHAVTRFVDTMSALWVKPREPAHGTPPEAVESGETAPDPEAKVITLDSLRKRKT